MPLTQIIGRLAPTPTGYLHVGNARTFLATWLAVRSAGGRMILRVEDIDFDRVRPQFEAQQLEDMRWLGLDWDEGPDVGGKNGPYRQSERLEQYSEALRKLQAAGRVYPCVCTRKEVTASAPHEGEEAIYPGTCRGRFADAADAHAQSGRECAWRFRVEAEDKVDFVDVIADGQAFDANNLGGDFVVQRKKGCPGYQLAVVVDDIEMGVTQIVRGDDLLMSAARQLLIRNELNPEEKQSVEWAHLPMVYDDQDRRLAKRNDDLSLKALKESGVSPQKAIGVLAKSLGLVESADSISLTDLVDDFNLKNITKNNVQIVRSDFD